MKWKIKRKKRFGKKEFFSRAAFGVAAAAALCGGCGWRQGGTGEPGQGIAPWRSTDVAMGTVVQQTVYAEDGGAAEEFSRQAMALLARLEREEISWRLDSSEAARINVSAGREEGILLSEDMDRLLEACLELWERSEGAFDVTLGPVARLWDIDRWAASSAAQKAAQAEEGDVSQSAQEAGFRVPSEEEIAKALRLCGSGRLRTEGQGPARLYLPEGMQLDLGAVGKGYAMSKLYALLEESPAVTGAVLSLGGSILTYGDRPDGGPWRVGIVDPFDTSASIGTLELEGQWCVSTSGDYERYVEAEGRRYHHILDPKTGAPAVCGVRGATVLMKDGLLSDGLSTACFLLGPEKGMALAGQYGAEVLFVLADGRVELSEGMKRYYASQP